MILLRLIASLLISLIISLKITEWYLENLLFDLLAKEVSIPTGCSLQAKVWNISLFHRSGEAEDVSIHCASLDGDSYPVQVSKIYVEFHLHEILRRKVILDMYISSATSAGFWKGSVLYKFIDYLSLEPQNPPLLRLKLRHLKVANMHSSEHIFNYLTEFNDSSIEYLREDSGLLRLKFWTRRIENPVLTIRNTSLKLTLDEEFALIDEANASFLDGAIGVGGRIGEITEITLDYKDPNGYLVGRYLEDQNKTELNIRSERTETSLLQFLLQNLNLDIQLENPAKLLEIKTFNFRESLRFIHLLISSLNGEINFEKLRLNSSVELSGVEIRFDRTKSLNVGVRELRSEETNLNDIKLDVNLQRNLMSIDLLGPVSIFITVDLNSMTFDGTANFLDYSLEKIKGSVRDDLIDFSFDFSSYSFSCLLNSRELRCANSDNSAILSISQRIDLQLNRFQHRSGCVKSEASGQLIYSRNRKFVMIEHLEVDLNCQHITDNLKIQDFKVDLTGFNVKIPVQSRGGTFQAWLRGNLSSFKVNVYGNLYTSKIISLPLQGFFYNLRSTADLEFSFEGLNLVSVNGKLSVNEGQIKHMSGLFDASNIFGNVEVENSKLKIENIQGTVNQGSFSVWGSFILNNPLEYSLTGKVEGAVVRTDSGSIVLNGSLTTDDGLHVSLDIVEASISIPERSLLDNILARSKSETLLNVAEMLKAVPFSFSIKTMQPVTVESDKFFARLWGQANVINQQGALEYGGSFNFLDGYINISSNSFPVRRGQVRLDPVVGLWLDLECSRSFYYARSFPVEVFVTVSGPILDPKVSLDSIPRLEQDQLQRIVLTRDPAFFNISPRGVTLLKDSDIPLEFIPRFIRESILPRELAFDVKSTEGDQTAYAVQFGKEILPDLQILAESVLYDTYTVNNIRLKLSAFDHLDIIGEVSDNPLLSATGFSVDFLFKIIGGSKRQIYKFEGVSSLNERALRRKLPELSLISIEDLPMLERFITYFYRTKGFREVKVSAECKHWFQTKGQTICSNVEFKVLEGRLWLVKNARSKIVGDLITTPLPFNWSTMQRVLEIYISNSIRRGLLPMDFKEEVSCDAENGIVSCSVEIVTDNLKYLQLNSQLDNNLTLEIMNNLATMRLFNNLAQKTAWIDYARLWGLKTGRVLQFEIQDTSNHITVTLKQADLVIQPIVDGGECRLEIFRGISLNSALASIKNKLTDCSLNLVSYSIQWDSENLAKLRIQTSSLNERELVFEQFSDIAPVKIGDLTESQLRGLVQTKLRDEGILVEADMIRFSDVKANVYVHVDNYEELRIKEVRIVFANGRKNENLVEQVKKFVGALASNSNFSSIRQVVESFRTYRVLSTSFDPSTKTLELLVEYLPRDVLKIGAGYHTDLGIHLFSIAENQSLFSRGQTVSGKVDLYLKEDLSVVQTGSVSISYTDPLLNHERLQLESFGSFQRTKQSQLPFGSERYTISLSLNRLSGYFLKPKLGLHHDYLFDVNSDLTGDSNKITSPFVGLEAKLESLDSVVYPTDGYSIRLEATTGFLDFNYFELRNLLVKHIPVSDSLSGHLSLRYNHVISSEAVPLPYRYFVGGRDTLRGYSLFKLGKKGALGSPLGGERFVSSQNELHLLVTDSVILTGFVDLGLLDDFDKNSLGIGVGMGVKYISPVGPVGVEVARGIYDNDSARDLAFYLSLGLTF